MFIVWRVIVPLHQASLGVSRQSDGSPDTENPVSGAPWECRCWGPAAPNGALAEVVTCEPQLLFLCDLYILPLLGSDTLRPFPRMSLALGFSVGWLERVEGVGKNSLKVFRRRMWIF